MSSPNLLPNQTFPIPAICELFLTTIAGSNYSPAAVQQAFLPRNLTELGLGLSELPTPLFGGPHFPSTQDFSMEKALSRHEFLRFLCGLKSNHRAFALLGTRWMGFVRDQTARVWEVCMNSFGRKPSSLFTPQTSEFGTGFLFC